MLSPLEAARQTGKSKTAILKAIGRGRVSAKKDDKGQWKIDPAELFRVYPPVKKLDEDKSTDVETLRLEISLLRDQLERERKISERLERQADRADEERRATQEKLTALLTDQSGNSGGLWSRLFGR